MRLRITMLLAAQIASTTLAFGEILALSGIATRYSSSGDVIGSFAPFGTWQDAAVDLNGGFLYLASFATGGEANQYGRIWRYDSNTGAFGPITPRPDFNGGIRFRGLATSESGELFAISQTQIARVSSEGGITRVVSVANQPNTLLDRIAVSSQNGSIFATSGSSFASEYSLTTGSLLRNNLPLTGLQIAEGPDGNLYSGSDFGVRRLDIVTGAWEQVVGTTNRPTSGIAFDPSGRLFYSSDTHHILSLDPSGVSSGQYSTSPVPGDGRITLEFVPDGFLDMPIALMPEPITSDVWTFPPVNVTTNVVINYDPPVVTGYDYFVSGPAFQSVTLPTGIGDGQFQLFLWNGAEYIFATEIAGGANYQFALLGVDRFRIMGIETSAEIDPADATAFVTSLTFASSGTASVSMMPHVAVPEPSTFVLGTLAITSLIFLGTKYH